jgi:hypothetical protein
MQTMSADAARRLPASPPEAGRVHSVFERAVNLEWHDGRLLTLHGPGALLAPFAVALDCFPCHVVKPGQSVRRRVDSIVLDGMVFEWSGAATLDTTMPDSAGESSTTLLSMLPQAAHQGAGLSSIIARRARSRLAEGLSDRTPGAFIDGALGLLGLGEGLTPAGDDCLVGALAVVHRFARPWLTTHPEIESRVKAASATATTTIAREFVTHALEGRFAESLVDLMSAESAEETDDAASRLLRTGATSGADTLCGIRLALAALATDGGRSAWRQ